MGIIDDMLARNGLSEPDGRPLHAFRCTEDEHRRLGDLLRRQRTPAGFALWAAERIRAQHQGGRLKWDFLFDPLGLPYEWKEAERLANAGLTWWRRRVRRSEEGRRLFLYSLMAEGGAPDALLAEQSRFREALLGTLGEIEQAGLYDIEEATHAALRRLATLPQTFRNDEFARLLAEIAVRLALLRNRLDQSATGSTASQLDRIEPGWREQLPLRLSDKVLEKLIVPALAIERPATDMYRPAVRRELRWHKSGVGWVGITRLVEDGFVTHAMLPFVKDRSLRLRFLAETGTVLLGVPEDGGWRLGRTGSHAALDIALAPDAAVILKVYADGGLLGSVMLDAGLLPPDEAPSLWCASGADAIAPDKLMPFHGTGRTRASRLWLLVDAAAMPSAGPGVVLDTPEPGPGGTLWPLRGKGIVAVEDRHIPIATGTDADEPAARLIPVGAWLPRWRATDNVAVTLGPADMIGEREGASPT